jgi:hypothetical protein
MGIKQHPDAIKVQAKGMPVHHSVDDNIQLVHMSITA